MNTKRTARHLPVYLVAAVLVCLCAGCFAAALGSQYFSRSAFLGTRVCAGFTTTPRFRVGIAWTSALSSYMGPLMMSPTAVCASLPGMPPGRLFGLNGEWMFPP